MSIIEALILGIVQGLTEFLPVSSSGHLVLAHSFFGLGEPKMFFDICLHFATMIAVLIFFRRKVAGLFSSSGRVWRKCIAIGTVPGVIAGLLFEKHVTFIFASPRIVSAMLIVTAAVLILAQVNISRQDRITSAISPLRALCIGFAQAIAIIPGLSRSAFTISAGISSGLSAEEAFDFSFLLSVPIIAGATLYKLISVMSKAGGGGVNDAAGFAVGMFFAFLSGLMGLFFLKKAVLFGKIWVFSAYCFLVGSFGLFMWR